MKPYEPTWRSLCAHAVPDWFRDAKFGIYTHWGPYTVPAYGGGSDALVGKRGSYNSAWYPRHMYDPEHACSVFHQKTYGGPAKTGYKDLIPQLTAEKFDPEEWIEVFQQAGARFAGPTAQLHDGFAMWDSKVNRWNCAAMGPRRDVMGELAGEGPTKATLDMSKGGHFNETGEPRFCAHDIRFTTAGNALYATCLGVPGDMVIINTFKERVNAAEIRAVRLLGYDGPLAWRMDPDEGLMIETPMPMPSEYANSFKIEMNSQECTK